MCGCGKHADLYTNPEDDIGVRMELIAFQGEHTKVDVVIDLLQPHFPQTTPCAANSRFELYIGNALSGAPTQCLRRHGRRFLQVILGRI